MPSSSQPSTVSRRTFAPVASSALSNAISCLLDSLTVRPPASSAITLVRVSSSTFCSPHHSSGRKKVSCRRLGTAQVGLRAVRPVVGRVRLAADDQDLAVGTFLAQPTRAIAGGEAAADQR